MAFPAIRSILDLGEAYLAGDDRATAIHHGLLKATEDTLQPLLIAVRAQALARIGHRADAATLGARKI